MRWSQLKSRIEDTFAESVKGRIEVWSTRYRHAVHRYGEAWITLDKQKIATMGTLAFDKALFQTAKTLGAHTGSLHYDEANILLQKQGMFSAQDVNKALYGYLNLGIDAAAKSTNPVVSAFAMLDKRVGKRRLREFDARDEHPLVVQFYQLRCRAEGIRIRPLSGATECTEPAGAGRQMPRTANNRV